MSSEAHRTTEHDEAHTGDNDDPLPEEGTDSEDSPTVQETLSEDNKVLSSDEAQRLTQESLAEDAIIHLPEEQALDGTLSSGAAGSKPKVIQVPNAYFPACRGGSVDFYHDAMSVPVPPFGDSEGVFAAIEKALLRAKDFIFVIGYSLWPDINLRREENSPTLGEILIQRASEGVEVKILLWREIIPIFKYAELRRKEIKEYFCDSEVELVFAARHKKPGAGFLQHKKAPFMWAHHQKSLVLDSGTGEILAFLGGLDITKGRWDTPDHQLFSTLDKEHKDDFRNLFIAVSPECGPRQPWHDVHMRVSGPVTRDIFQNFRERWEKERRRIANKEDVDDYYGSYDPEPTQIWSKIMTNAATESGGTQWVMQLLRSIEETSADFERKASPGLVDIEGCWVDQSIQQGVIEIIRNARGYLYIENQYFVGSSKYWEKEAKVEAKNPIPYEIVEKTIQKIRAGEQFCSYIVIPMLPEGNIEGHVCSRIAKKIMHGQLQTIQMMYRRLAKELQAIGSDAHPTDYLVFLCLGKQEAKPDYAAGGAKEPEPGAKEWKWHDLSHFMIYVHSKLIIADDCYLLAGSANFNERSFAGNRDTEIAALVQQTRTVDGAEEVVCDGQIHDFRRRLWAEHTWGLSEADSSLKDLASLEAIRRVKELSKDALRAYVRGAEENSMRLLRFPVDITRDGAIQAYDDLPFFPDFELMVIEDIMDEMTIEECM